MVSRFKQRFPDIHLQVHAQASADVVSGLLSNRLDIGICLLPLTHPQLTTVRLFEERLALVAPAGMNIDAYSGLIAWTPAGDQVGAQTVIVRVTDPGGLFATQSFTIAVAGQNAPPAAQKDG